MPINELLRNTSNPNLNPATSKSTHKIRTKNMTKEEVNDNFKRNINNLSLRKKLKTRREMNKYLRMNVSKPNPPLGRLIEGQLKENALARSVPNIPAYTNVTKRNRQNNNNSGPSSKRPRPNNKTRRIRKH